MTWQSSLVAKIMNVIYVKELMKSLNKKKSSNVANRFKIIYPLLVGKGFRHFFFLFKTGKIGFVRSICGIIDIGIQDVNVNFAEPWSRLIRDI